MTGIHRERRRAFTLVEMLVASALILFMMWIIAAAFEKALESFRVLKTAGDMQEKLRAAATAIRRDLTRPHFDPTSGETWGGENLGDQQMDNPAIWQPPSQGYFRVFSSGTPRPVDGLDPDDNTAVHYRVADAVAQGDMLQFTVKLRGVRRDQMFLINVNDPGLDPQSSFASASPLPFGRLHRFSYPAHTVRELGPFPIPPVLGGGSYPSYPGSVEPTPTTFTSTWADVTYFLRPNGSTAGTQPLFSLYRRQNLLMGRTAGDANDPNLPERVRYTSGPSPRPLDVPPNDSRYFEVSNWRCPSDGSWRVNFPNAITAPCRRFGVNPNDPAGIYQGPTSPPTFTDQVLAAGGNLDNPLTATDLVLTDVTDFSVKLLWEPTPQDGTMPVIQGPQPLDATVPGTANPDFPFDRVPAVPVSANSGWNNTSGNPQRIFDTWSQRKPVGLGPGQIDDYGTPTSVGGPPPWNKFYTGGGADNKSIPIKIRVRAVQIQLRIWDVKSQQSRQVTIIQDV